MNSTVKTVVFWLVIVLSAFLLWQVMKAGSAGQKEKEINFSQFMADVDQGNVKEVTITNQEVRGKYRNDNSPFHLTAPANYPDMIKVLRDKGVTMNFRDISGVSWPLQLLGTWAPLILLAALWFFMIRQMQTGGNKALSFGKSRARLLSMRPSDPRAGAPAGMAAPPERRHRAAQHPYPGRGHHAVAAGL